MSEFFQDPPRLGNQYDDDAFLRDYLRWRLPAEMLAEVEPELRRLGHRTVTDILALGESAEASLRHPDVDGRSAHRAIRRAHGERSWRE